MSQHIHSAEQDSVTSSTPQSPQNGPGMSLPKHTTIDGALQILMEDGLEGLKGFLEAAINIAMLAEREQFIGAGHYQRSERHTQTDSSQSASTPHRARSA